MTAVPRETEELLREFGDQLIAENERQNLVSRSTIATLWSRHIEDSRQLLDHAPRDATWLDIGSGPGLPGLVLAIHGVRAITLVEPRRLRTDFLERCRDRLGLGNVTIVTGKVEQLQGRYDVITARAVASLDRLFALSHRLASPGGRWVLPKGRTVAKELEEARRTWQGRFELRQSATDPDGRIVIAEELRRRVGRG